MFASNREGLTWRPSRDEIDLAVERCPIHSTYIHMRNSPIPDVLHLSLPIELKRRHRVGVPFDHQFMVKTRARKTERQTAAPAKKLNTLHIRLFTQYRRKTSPHSLVFRETRPQRASVLRFNSRFRPLASIAWQFAAGKRGSSPQGGDVVFAPSKFNRTFISALLLGRIRPCRASLKSLIE